MTMSKSRLPKPAQPKFEKPPKQYLEQLEQMHHNTRLWRAQNRDREVMITFNYPPGMCVIAPISEAIRRRLVIVNGAGMELLRAMWPRWDDATEPTVNMVRVVLEHEPKYKRPLPSKCPGCGEFISVAGTIGKREPGDKTSEVEAGSITVCMCGALSIFNPDLTLRALPDAEFQELPEELRKMLQTAVNAIKANPLLKRKK